MPYQPYSFEFSRYKPGHTPTVFVLGNFVLACCWQVPRLPVPGESLAAQGYSAEVGGKGLNVAVGLKRLGLQVHTLLACGRDDAAQRLRHTLEAEGLAQTHVHAFDAPSGCGSGWIAPDGRNAIAVFEGANALLGTEEVRLASNDLLASDLVYGQFETAMEATEDAFTLAHGAGIATVLNPSPWKGPQSPLRQTTRIVLVNEVEAAQLLNLTSPLATTDGPHSPSRAQIQRDLGPTLPAFWAAWPACELLVVTLGPLGVVGLHRQGHRADWPALPIEAVDTVGAGDAFAAGFCHALVCGHPWPDALWQGNVCAAWVSARRGVLSALPRSEDLGEIDSPSVTP